MESLYQKGIRFFFISDDTFTIQKKRVISICKGIIQKGMKVSWNAISRVDHVDDDTLYWMRRAGCIQISYGIESGSPKIRKSLNKQIDTERVKRAFKLTTRYGILARAYFIYGCPGETEETIEETIRLILEIKPMGTIFYILDLFPGTDLYESWKKNQGISDDIWLNRIEGIMYFETDPSLTHETILDYGRSLRKSYYENLHTFVDAIQLIDREDLYELHADFCSRLGMTFSHGDYARNEFVREKDKTAEKLYRMALSYYPDHRAYLGLGILKQKALEFEASIQVCREGIKHFPDSQELGLCLGVSYMNLRNYEDAIHSFQRVSESKKAKEYMALCYRELGDR
jgi:tetratricopeptide (TPR) repeat protein